MSGRKGKHPLKIRNDLRPKKVLNKLSRFASYKLPPGCGRKRIIIVTTRKVSRNLLILDRKSVILKANYRVVKAIRAAKKICPLQEEELK
ncbi:hypothetical protein PoB_006323400 [Plakobranchus ocellatus]|uniref:60S ribosomal protein L28 n=1 Tax=Plakobranchus ocellatus TaxID=259542 RepID=A0AAV4CXV0_9GAST|nr:hypothetical protein PoB_006323400 [Plakobranchus ocellatus]